MNKLKYIFSFFNKNGIFALGLVLGIVLALFFSSSVKASTIDGTSSSSVAFDFTTTWQYYDYPEDNSSRYYCVLNDSLEPVSVLKNAVGFLTFQYEKSNGMRVYNLRIYVSDSFKNTYTVYKQDLLWRGNPQNSNNIAGYHQNYVNENIKVTYETIGILPFYCFDDEKTALDYLSGAIDGSSAMNYDEIMENNKDYDSSIPVPVKAYINVITDSTVSSVFSYDETELENFKSQYGYELQYEYEVEYFYQMLSKLQINNQKSNLVTTEKNKDSNSYSLDKNGLFVSSGTAGELYETFSANQLIDLQYSNATADTGPYSSTGVVSLDNAVTSSPPNYYDLYSIPFSLTSMEYHMQFILAQVRISTFYVDDFGVKHCSDDIYIRRSLWDKDNEVYGSTYTRITKDNEGNDSFQSSHVIDSNGNDVSGTLGSFTVDSVEQYIKNGYGLTGSDGYIEMSKRFFDGVPEYIWTIIAFALSINLIVILFKVLRGM